MDKCCRWCSFYNNKSGYCFHDEMFEVVEKDTEYEVIGLEMNYAETDDTKAHWYIDEVLFKVINPEEFSCCYWE